MCQSGIKAGGHSHSNDISNTSAKLRPRIKNTWSWMPKESQIWWLCWLCGSSISVILWHGRQVCSLGRFFKCFFLNPSTPSFGRLILQNNRPQDEKIMELAAENSPKLETLLALWQLDIRYLKSSGMVCRSIFLSVFLFNRSQRYFVRFCKPTGPSNKNLWGLMPKTAQHWWFCWLFSIPIFVTVRYGL